MRYAIISDIHANLEAFRAVFDRIARSHVDKILCLGDVIGYNADPNACIEIVRAEKIISILGNHDAVACDRGDSERFNPLARQAILWTRKQLSGENREFLCALPRERSVNGLFLCHGTIHNTNHYIVTRDDVRDAFGLMASLPQKPHICFHGHSHLPSAFRSKAGVIAQEMGETVTIMPDHSYLINPGSIGQPRDGDPRAAFAIYDEDSGQVSFFRIEYDRETCQNKILKAALPPNLALRLDLGR